MFFKPAFVVVALAAFARAADESESSEPSSSAKESSSASRSSSASSGDSTGSSSSSSSGGELKIITPSSVVTCQPVMLSWSGGKAPYFPSIIPGEEPSSAPIIQFNETEKTSYKWMVNMAPDSFITIQIKDSDGNINYASALNIQAGQTEDCVDKSLASPTGTASGGSTSGGSTGTTTTDSTGTDSTDTDSTDTTAEDSSAPADDEAGSGSRLALSGAAALVAALAYAL